MQLLSLGILPPHDAEETRVREAGSNGNGLGKPAKAPPANQLPPAIEALREKLSDKIGPPPAAQLTATVNTVSLGERGAVPTFGTFKFGYIPGRGLLYSVIGHEVALFGLFLLFTYG